MVFVSDKAKQQTERLLSPRIYEHCPATRHSDGSLLAIRYQLRNDQSLSPTQKTAKALQGLALISACIAYLKRYACLAESETVGWTDDPVTRFELNLDAFRTRCARLKNTGLFNDELLSASRLKKTDGFSDISLLLNCFVFLNEGEQAREIVWGFVLERNAHIPVVDTTLLGILALSSGNMPETVINTVKLHLSQPGLNFNIESYALLLLALDGNTRQAVIEDVLQETLTNINYAAATMPLPESCFNMMLDCISNPSHFLKLQLSQCDLSFLVLGCPFAVKLFEKINDNSWVTQRFTQSNALRDLTSACRWLRQYDADRAIALLPYLGSLPLFEQAIAQCLSSRADLVTALIDPGSEFLQHHEPVKQAVIDLLSNHDYLKPLLDDLPNRSGEFQKIFEMATPNQRRKILQLGGDDILPAVTQKQWRARTDDMKKLLTFLLQQYRAYHIAINYWDYAFGDYSTHDLSLSQEGDRGYATRRQIIHDAFNDYFKSVSYAQRYGMLWRQGRAATSSVLAVTATVAIPLIALSLCPFGIGLAVGFCAGLLFLMLSHLVDGYHTDDRSDRSNGLPQYASLSPQ